MPVWNRGWLAAGGIALTSAVLMSGATSVRGDERAVAAASAPSGRLSEAELGNLIRAMGINVKLDERRYDFAFKAIYNKSEWSLSMSAVLSENGNSIWVIAWLDECPKSAAEVPRTALLGLLAKNDTMGNGKFFAYIPGNNRFVLQRVVANENMTTAHFREILQDLGTSVVETYPRWSVAGWKQPEHGRAAEGAADGRTRVTPAPTAVSSPQASAGRAGIAEPTSYRTQN